MTPIGEIIIFCNIIMKQSHKIVLIIVTLIVFCYAQHTGPMSMNLINKTPSPTDNFFFKNTKFSSSCCPSMYSSSSGCACMSEKQINQIQTRGGNDPY